MQQENAAFSKILAFITDLIVLTIPTPMATENLQMLMANGHGMLQVPNINSQQKK